MNIKTIVKRKKSLCNYSLSLETPCLQPQKKTEKKDNYCKEI